MKRNVVVVSLLVLCLVAAVHAHVVVTPRESPAGAEQIYTVRVPTEGAVSTISLELDIPAGLHVTQVGSGEGFASEVRKEKDRIVAIIWKREIEPKAFALFTFTAHNPSSGALLWKAHQTFKDGSVRHWIGEPGSKEPASATKIVPKAGATPAPADPAH